MSNSSQRDCALKLLDHIESQVRLADTKASFVLAINAVLVGALLKSINDFKATGWPLVLCLVALALLIVSFYCALLSVFPRFFGSKSFLKRFGTQETRDTTVFFFGDIAEMTAAEFSSALVNKSESELNDQLFIAVRNKAEWAKAKFTQIRLTGWCIAVASLVCTLGIMSVILSDDRSAPVVRPRIVAEMRDDVAQAIHSMDELKVRLDRLEQQSKLSKDLGQEFAALRATLESWIETQSEQ